VVSGGALRYRLYSSRGLAGPAIGQVILFSGATFWVGFLALGGAAFLFRVPAQTAALGGHHFGGDYDAIARLILEAAHGGER
jgi:uncharacterized membrane protein YbhN (UPF0104 family)